MTTERICIRPKPTFDPEAALISQQVEFDRLDRIAEQMRSGDISSYGVLSTSQRIYVALASNRPDLLQEERYRWTMVQVIARLGDEWLRELIERWRYR